MSETSRPDASAVPADPAGAPRTPRRSLRRLGVLAVVASFVGIWGYVMYLSIFEGRAEPRDRLDDTRWTAAAEETCADARRAIDELPFANEVDSPPERAELLDAATDQLEVLVTRVDALVPPRAPDEATAVSRWIADYRTYLEDRRQYADAQRDPSSERYDRPFSVTDRGGYQIDVLIDDFARVNHMESCETPDDV